MNNQMKKLTFIVTAFLLLIQLSVLGTEKKENNIVVISNNNLNGPDTSSLNDNFHDTYNDQWKNLDNFNNEFKQRSIKNKEPSGIGTPAIEIDNCESILATVDSVNFSESMLAVDIGKTYQSDNNQGCCYKNQPQGHMHPKRLKLEYIGSGNPWIVFRFKNSTAYSGYSADRCGLWRHDRGHANHC
jgi:hypothetical protein